jgi:outer membrane receptor protein involved in Fe transport
VLLAWTPATAQQTGQITGQVIDASNGAPLEAAQVYVEGSNLGTLTSANGRYLLLEVPSGTHQIRVERLGYAAATQEVTVTAGGTQTVDFQVSEQAIGLDELVVTGEAGAARRREVGHSVSQMNMSDLVEAPRDIEEMMGGRVPGAVITEASGAAGSGNQIRLRGINSVTMGNSPLLYVDGIRVRSEAYPKNVPPVGYSGRSGNVTASPLADINPEDIDRIEVIKGSAATALYGTEASAGVIQVFTKRGSARGEPQFTVGSTMSLRHMQKFGAESYEYIDSDGTVLGNSDYLFMDRHWLRNALGQEFFVNASGGFANTSYFLSGTVSDVDYPLPNDSERSFALRGNLGFALAPNLTLEWNTSFTKTHITNTASGDNAQGVTLNAWRPTTSYTGTVPSLRETINELLNFEIDTYIDHFTTGFTTRHVLSERFDHRLAVGFDRSYTEGRNYRPFGFRLQPNGVISSTRWVGEVLTLDYAGSYTQPLGGSLETTLSAGAQVVESEETSVTGHAEQFPGPGDATISSGAVSLAFEDRIRIINAGFFVQSRLGFRDRLFLTLGVRVDGNSAFGEGLGLQPYPKASISYVVSDESFWSPSWGVVKLRAAYGQAGRAPGAFDAVRTWEPVKISGTSAFLPQNLGNPNLGPERTAELEFGVTGSFLSNRLDVDFTFYNQTTTDALFPVRTPPSGGGWDSQLENVGKLRNRGVELAVNGAIVDGATFGWDLGLMVYTNNSRLLDLGEAPEFTVAGGAYLREGHPAPVLCGPRVTNPEEFADPTYEEDHCWGPSQPTLTVTPSTMLRLPWGLRLSARGEFLGGHYIYDANTYGQIGRGEAFWGGCIGINQMFAEGRLSEINSSDRNRCLQQYAVQQTPMNRGDFFKVRDVSLRIPLSFWTSVEYPTLTLSGRNVWRWLNSDWRVLDPEIGCNTGHDCLVYSPQEHLPPPATYTLSLRLGF